MKIEDSGWHNTGGNGQASAVWVRKVGRFEANVHVMRYRCMLDTWIGGSIVDEGQPFEDLERARAFADRFILDSLISALNSAEENRPHCLNCPALAGGRSFCEG